jgi:hypothetical protein
MNWETIKLVGVVVVCLAVVIYVLHVGLKMMGYEFFTNDLVQQGIETPSAAAGGMQASFESGLIPYDNQVKTIDPDDSNVTFGQYPNIFKSAKIDIGPQNTFRTQEFPIQSQNVGIGSSAAMAYGGVQAPPNAIQLEQPLVNYSNQQFGGGQQNMLGGLSNMGPGTSMNSGMQLVGVFDE